ncbi:MAG: thioredoxin family protein [Rhodocyclales bacterium]|nr:thioredoxin family protein [Rhodocyclales bacterium]
MLKRLASLLFFFLCAGAVLAADVPFDRAQFDALNQAGKPILVTVHAEWCPTCRAQAPIVAELLKTPELQGITALRVDFDRQKDALKAFKVQYQSTLIVFKGGKEVGRSTGDTRQHSIATLLKKAL